MKIKFFKIKKNFKKGNFQINPNFFWKIILSLALIIAVSSFVFGFYVFMNLNSEINPETDTTSAQAGTIKKDRLEKILKYFSDKEKKSAEILNSPSPIIDPSL